MGRFMSSAQFQLWRPSVSMSSQHARHIWRSDFPASTNLKQPFCATTNLTQTLFGALLFLAGWAGATNRDPSPLPHLGNVPHNSHHHLRVSRKAPHSGQPHTKWCMQHWTLLRVRGRAPRAAPRFQTFRRVVVLHHHDCSGRLTLLGPSNPKDPRGGPVRTSKLQTPCAHLGDASAHNPVPACFRQLHPAFLDVALHAACKQFMTQVAHVRTKSDSEHLETGLRHS